MPSRLDLQGVGAGLPFGQPPSIIAFIDCCGTCGFTPTSHAEGRGPLSPRSGGWAIWALVGAAENSRLFSAASRTAGPHELALDPSSCGHRLWEEVDAELGEP